MNRIVSPHESVSLFLKEKRSDGLAAATLTSYQRSLAMFLETPDLPADVAELGPEHAIDFTATLTGRRRGLKPGAINAYQRPVWVWLNWLYLHRFCHTDITRRVHRYPVPAPKRRTASTSAKDLMLVAALDRKEHPYRNAAIVELLWASGPRRKEVAGILLEDVDLDRGVAWLRTTKGEHPRYIGVDMTACAAIERYLVRERGREPGPLFLARGRGAMTNNAIRCVIRSLAEAAGIEVSAHDFRRACAARLRREGMDIAHVMRQLGHKDETMTLIYSEQGESEASLNAYHARATGVRPIRRG